MRYLPLWHLRSKGSTSVYISYKPPLVRDISDHKLFDAKAALYIVHTNSPLIVGLNYEVLASFEG